MIENGSNTRARDSTEATPAAGQRDTRIGRVALGASVASVVALAATVVALMVPAIRTWLAADAAPPSYVEGGQIDLGSAAYSSTPYTIFLFSRASCRACQASRSVMAAMVSDVAERSDVNVMLVTGPELSSDEESFARDVGLARSRVLQADVRRLRLRYVPTVVLTDATGKILMAKEGLLTETDRMDVVRRTAATTAD